MKGCIIGLLAGLLGLFLAFWITFIMAKLVIWCVMGLFNYDLSDKFWYVFGAIMLINALLGSSVKRGGQQ